MAAKFKEVVVTTDGANLKKLGPHRGEFCFPPTVGRFVGSVGGCSLFGAGSERRSSLPFVVSGSELSRT